MQCRVEIEGLAQGPAAGLDPSCELEAGERACVCQDQVGEAGVALELVEGALDSLEDRSSAGARSKAVLGEGLGDGVEVAGDEATASVALASAPALGQHIIVFMLCVCTAMGAWFVHACLSR